MFNRRPCFLDRRDKTYFAVDALPVSDARGEGKEIEDVLSQLLTFSFLKIYFRVFLLYLIAQ